MNIGVEGVNKEHRHDQPESCDDRRAGVLSQDAVRADAPAGDVQRNLSKAQASERIDQLRVAKGCVLVRPHGDDLTARALEREKAAGGFRGLTADEPHLLLA